MKICAIRGENLTSFSQPFALELDQEPLRHAGLFALSGPTGSGKSTLLDALCLSLFDRVPRFDRGQPVGVDGLRGSDPRQLLRHGTAEGHAEVEFVGVDGKRYKSRWSVRRARLLPDGKFQAQEMVLTDLATGAPIGRTKKEVLEEIEQRLGLNYAQFRRSVLLAQGDFAAFLRASEKERSELLERITGTEIYTRVSILAHEKSARHKQKIELLEQQLVGLAPAEKIAPEQLSDLKGALETTKAKQKSLLRDLQWHRAYSQAKSASEASEQQMKSVDALLAKQNETQITLALLEKARPLQPILYAITDSTKKLDALKKKQTTTERTLTRERKQLQTVALNIEEGKAALARLYALREVAVEISAIKKSQDLARTSIASIERKLSALRKNQGDANEQLILIAQLNKAHEFSQLRETLETDSPCPLCGSHEHPYSENIPEASQSVIKLREEEQALRQAVEQQTRAHAELEAEKAIHVASKADGESRLSAIRAKWTSDNLEEELALALTLPEANRIEADVEASSSQPKPYRQLESDRKRERELDRSLAALTDRLQQIRDDEKATTIQHKSLQAELSTKMETCSLTESNLKQTQSYDHDWEKEQRGRLHALQERRQQLHGELTQCQKQECHLLDQGKPGRDEVRVKSEELATRETIAALEKTLQNLTSQQLLNEKESERHQSLLASLEKSSRESEPYQVLHELIGSRDGSKFRKFAQGLTLSHLIGLTNHFLEEIGPRFRIEQHPESDLGLLIIDRDMGDELRTPETLSGGETFLVSLALALGLASLSSDQTQIESLFIDEGFGTLDQRSLDQALDALDQLQAMGRQIGIISHLHHLIERIGVTVKVIPSQIRGSRISSQHRT